MYEFMLTAIIVGRVEIGPGTMATDYLTVQHNQYEIVTVVVPQFGYVSEMEDLYFPKNKL